jgi:hypothetical protein
VIQHLLSFSSMAEILGLAATVLQLIDTLAKARGYINDFHSAPKDQQRLLLEIQNLEPLIKELDRRIQNTVEGMGSGLQEFIEPLTQLKGMLERLTKELKWEGSSKVYKRLTWPLWGKEDIEEKLRTIERFKSLLSNWLGIDIWSVIAPVL